VLDIKVPKNAKDKDIPAIQRHETATGGVIVLPKLADLSQQPVVDKAQGLTIVMKKLAAAA
jgi:hypothetical protein